MLEAFVEYDPILHSLSLLLSLESMMLKLLLYLQRWTFPAECSLRTWGGKKYITSGIFITTAEPLINLGDTRKDILAFAYKTMQILLDLTR